MYFSILKSLKAVLYNMCNNILKVYPKIGCLTAHHSPPQDRLLDTVLNRVSFLSFFLFLSRFWIMYMTCNIHSKAIFLNTYSNIINLKEIEKKEACVNTEWTHFNLKYFLVPVYKFIITLSDYLFNLLLKAQINPIDNAVSPHNSPNLLQIPDWLFVCFTMPLGHISSEIDFTWSFNK